MVQWCKSTKMAAGPRQGRGSEELTEATRKWLDYELHEAEIGKSDSLLSFDLITPSNERKCVSPSAAAAAAHYLAACTPA